MTAAKGRVIPGFPMYKATANGEIYSIKTKIFLKVDKRKSDQRGRVTLKSSNGTYVRKYRSHFVLLAWRGPKPKGMECLHKDGNCKNDCPRNLKYGTSSENKEDMKKHKTSPCGERSPTAKLTWPNVLRIRLMRSKGITLKEISDRYRVTQANVSAICNNKTWRTA